MPPGAWSTGSNDWIVLRITPLAPPSGLTNGFGPGPEALDVTAWWALAGTQLHEFAQPLSILMRTTEKGLAPATLDGGSWRFLRRVPTAGTLPSGWEDGFYARRKRIPRADEASVGVRAAARLPGTRGAAEPAGLPRQRRAHAELDAGR